MPSPKRGKKGGKQSPPAKPRAKPAAKQEDKVEESSNEGDFLEDFDFVPSIESLKCFPTQALFGASLGGLAGYMDYNYVENFGGIFSAALLILQVLDHENVVSLPWNHEQHFLHEGHNLWRKSRIWGTASAAHSVGRELKVFIGNNAYIWTGFAGGYLLVKGYLNSTDME